MEIQHKQLRIGIIGLGLIGGSIALNLHKQGYTVLGFSQNSATVDMADFQVEKAYNRLQECQVVFICTPLSRVIDTLSMIQKYLSPGTIVTDVGSVKESICQAAQASASKDIVFVGGHPMAGTEKQGFKHSFPELFKGCKWVLTESHSLLEGLISSMDAEVIVTDPQSHDRAVAIISHLPLLVSMALESTLKKYENSSIQELATQLASSGWRGMVRLAQGNPTLNKDLLSLNHEHLEEVYKLFSEHGDFLLKEHNSQ